MNNLTKPQQLIYDMEKFVGGSIATICGSIIIKGEREEKKLINAVNTLFLINDALRIKIVEKDGVPYQIVKEYKEQKTEVLRFNDKTELDNYAQKYAKEPLDFYGSLCDIRVVVLDNAYGILVKLHHIISDAWTLALIGSQFSALVNSKTPESYSYIDYISAEQKYLDSNRYQNDKDYYIEQFKKCDEVTYISDKQVNAYTSHRKTFVIDKSKTTEIAKYAKENNTSLYMLFMTTLGTYVNRVKMNVEKFYIGTAILNHTNAREKNTMGMFVNTTPVLIELENEKSFAENLKNIAKTLFSVIRHQKFNYGDVLKTLRGEFGFSGNLYDIMLSYQNAKVVGVEGEFESTWYHSGMQSESLQIHIDDRDSEGILKIHYDYQTEKFTENEIEKLHTHLFNLLFDAIDNEDKPINKLELLTKEEKHKLLYEFNDTKADYPKDKCIHQIFEEQAAKTPDKIAVIACDKTLTYDELNRLSNRIAHGLIAKGVQKGDIVAFALPRKSYLIATMFGILKSGAAYMPLDPNYPQDRIDYMIEDSKAKFFITDSNFNEFVSDNEGNLNFEMTQDDKFCVLHTSGSTGLPKCAAIKHKNMVNFIYSNHFLLTDIECVVAINTVTFDVFEMDTIFTLCQEKSCVLANEKQQYSQSDFEQMMMKYKHCLFWATPTKMLNYINNSNSKKFMKNIDCYVVGGEIVIADFLDTIREYNPNIVIYTVYGPTETLIYSTLTDVSITNDITLGKPIANTQIYIVDKFNNLMPIGITGELCIAGDGVGAGYLNRPELTAEKFIDNPFGEGKLYKTGDLAYWREDGNIAYVGRNDFQVKIRGLRIELGEIENAICTVDEISQAVVVVRKDGNGRQLICAFYTEKSSVDVAKIKSAILSKLPKYMLPHIFTALEGMPLTPSGKINRKALPEIDLTNISNDTEYVEPKTDNEFLLCSAVESVLKADKVGTADNFFDLGGDSLKAIELLSKLELKGYKASIEDIFDSVDICELAKHIEKTSEENAEKEFSGDIPATDAQMRVYTSQSMSENSIVYNVPYCFKADCLDSEKLQIAVNKLIQRHESLRTHFENKNGRIIQVIENDVKCVIEKVGVDKVGDAVADTAINSFIRPFDLSKAPLIRVGYCDNIVMIDMHHIITDGGSMPVFIKELNELYMERDIFENAVQYKEFALKTNDFSKSEKYWLDVYSDELPELEINTDFKRGQKQSFEGNTIYDFVSEELHKKISAKCKELNVTPFVFYMGAFNILLSKFSGNEDIVVGMPISGRDGKFMDTIGMFVNTVAMRNKPVGTKTVSEFLDEVKENSINAIANQDYPFGELVKKLNIDTQNRNPIFDVMFAYQSEEMTGVVFGDKKAELIPVPITTAKYDFTFNVMPREKDVVIMAEYCTDLYKENTIKRFIAGFKRILEAMLCENSYIYDISAMSGEEENKILYEFNDTKADYPKDKCIHQIFEEQAAKTPDKIAVIACDKTLTYDELNRLSNRIAHGLIAKGVKKCDIIAFALPRKSYLIATMFGILKSGAAYMPIDPDYPQDRIDYMVEDSKAKFFITDNNFNEFVLNNEENPNVELLSDNPCYCIYTSGSTGLPKGTVINHKNVINYAYRNNNNNITNALIYKCRNIVSVTTVGFDIFVTESIVPLINGMEVILANESQANVQYSLNELLNIHKVDAIQTTPTKMKMFISDGNQLDFLRNLKVICLGVKR